MSTGLVIVLIIIAAGIAIWTGLKWCPDSWMWQESYSPKRK